MFGAKRLIGGSEKRARRPEPHQLVLFSIRRALGVSLFLFAFYLVLYAMGTYRFLTPTDVLTILGCVFAGTWLGIGFSALSPFPVESGFPRAVRTVLIVIPAIGIGIALQLFIEGARADMAIYAIFALAAWLGSTFIQEIDADEQGG